MFSVWLSQWSTKIYFFILRPLLKWVLHQVTGKCELLRISYNKNLDHVSRIMHIESSLKCSNSLILRQYSSETNFDVSEAVKKIFEVKKLVPGVHSQFEATMQHFLHRIHAYNKIIAEAEELRKQKYLSENPSHEKKLRQLWDAFNVGVELPSITGSHWTDMGFQGHDPGTDFRGMGLLGLEQLLYFGQNYPNEAQKVLSQSHHPQFGFSFAIVGINITEMGYTLLAQRKLRPHFYAFQKRVPDLNDFHQVYCHLLYEFTQFWISEEPRDIMEFSNVREKFLNKVQDSLLKPNVHLLSPFQEKTT
ncbi:ELMO domain-containing protein 2-like isoform X2 [Physella acuta]|uniref:ELMO domain-containing protein 2-like isoform X1 n=1 Tax=Physella acuta TaxID=109671 RepID=UPI0027DAE769|nr:ELMO domain-containing protein 2-like isoform X1 [Physella acuta]XP_059172506.1 ELMO domain-containing protein 2-like isoform X2 [Physella acuta]